MRLDSNEYYLPPELWDLVKSYSMGFIVAEYLKDKRSYYNLYCCAGKRGVRVPHVTIVNGAMTNLSLYGLYHHVLPAEDRAILQKFYRLKSTHRYLFFSGDSDDEEELDEAHSSTYVQVSRQMKCLFFELLHTIND